MAWSRPTSRGRCSMSSRDRQRARDRRRRKRGGEDEGSRGVHQITRHRLVTGHKRAIGPERLAERAHDHVDVLLETCRGQRAAPARTHGAGGMRLVDEYADAVLGGEFDDLLQRRDVAIDREHAVGGDQCTPALGLLNSPREVFDIAVVINEHLGAREPAPVDQGSVIALVGEHHIALGGPAPPPRRHWPGSPIRTAARSPGR